MSNTTPKRVPPGGASATAGAARRPTSTVSASPTPGARGASPSTVLSSSGAAGSPAGRSTPTGRPARPTARRPASSTTSTANAEEEAKAEEARAESAALIESLRKSLKDAEAASEDYQRQVAAMQQKVDELMNEQTKMEEQYHESSERIQELEFEAREQKRHAQEMDRIYENERAAMMRDREDGAAKEKELRATIQRLKESIAEREFRTSSSPGGAHEAVTDGTGKASLEEERSSFAPPSQNRTSSMGSTGARSGAHKEQLIESLRLELAESQIKIIEMENAGGSRMQDLERTLLETRMENARLQEDNESFQLLLGERTINGDFQKTELMQAQGGASPNAALSGMGSLADELASAEGGSAQARRLEVELKSVKDQNKALTLYIEKIISRVLQHDNFETILDQKGGLGGIPGRLGGASAAAAAAADKDLPPPPPPPARDETKPASSDGFLQRATSVVRRQRPVSTMFTGGAAPPAEDSPVLTARQPRPRSGGLLERQPTALENPATAPSIPLGRSVSVRGGRAPGHAHARGGSHDRTGLAPGFASASAAASSTSNPPVTPSTPDLPGAGAAGLVNQMYRGPGPASPGSTAGATTAAPLSPLLGSPGTTRGAYFGASSLRGSPPGTAATPTAATAPLPPRAGSESGASHATAEDTASRSSIGDAASLGSSVAPGASPPRDRAGNTQYTGAVMQQNRLRPLRLVQESSAADEAAAAARKKANRGSWMGWFNRGKEEGASGLGSTEEE